MRKTQKQILLGIGLFLGSLWACQAPPMPAPPLPLITPQAQFKATLHPFNQPRKTPPQAEVELGFRLFFEPRLSRNNRMSCATCHQPGKGFSNGEANAAGVNGKRGARNVPTIYTMDAQRHLFWDGRSPSLEDQALGPIQNPIEMDETLDNVIRKLSLDSYYPAKFRSTFGTEITAKGMARALASFERALKPEPAPYDRYLDGDYTALTPSQERGLELFGRQAHCGACHKTLDFSDQRFHNLGVGLDKPQPDLGRYMVTQNPRDWGAFKTPTLRNISKSAPYMHDGSLPTLEAVIDFYDQGGHPNQNLDPEMGRLHLSDQDKQDLLNFLKALDSPGDNLKAIGQSPGVTDPHA